VPPSDESEWLAEEATDLSSDHVAPEGKKLEPALGAL
jgi:hypothetical protein